MGLNKLLEHEFPVLRDPAKIRSVLNTCNKLLDERKLLGPFEPGSIEVQNFVTFFLVEKKGRKDEEGNQLYRLVVDGSREAPISRKVEERFIAWLDSQDSDKLARLLELDGGEKMILANAKRALGLKTNLNDFLESTPLEMDLVSDIIKGLRRCKSIAKADLKRGFRQVILPKESFKNVVLKLKIQHPKTKKIIVKWLIDCTAVQGLRPSPGNFNLVPRVFIQILVGFFPKLYSRKKTVDYEKELEAEWGVEWDPEEVAASLVKEMESKEIDLSTFDDDWESRLIFQYLDDLIFGDRVTRINTLQLLVLLLVGRKLGVEFENSKVVRPAPVQVILGLQLDTTNEIVSLKPDYAADLVVLLREIGREIGNSKDGHVLKRTQSALGKLTFASGLLPGRRLRALFANLQLWFNKIKIGEEAARVLQNQVKQDLNALVKFFGAGKNGPEIPLSTYTNEYLPCKIPSYTDACGWDESSPAMMAGFCGLKTKQFHGAVVWNLSFPDFTARLKDLGCECKNLPQKPTIAYMEFLTVVIHIGIKLERSPTYWEGRWMIVYIDNTNAISWVWKGTMRFSPWNHLLIYLLAIETKYKLRIEPRFVKSEENVIADSLTREFAKEKVLITPKGFKYCIDSPSSSVLRQICLFLDSPFTQLEESGFFDKFKVRNFHFLFSPLR